MEMVEDVATWAGLILGIASIVLAIVTIIFALATDSRSNQITQQTISSLQKIESSVERLSQDTNGLIKAAWDKMLEPPGRDFIPSEAAASDTVEIKALFEELKSEFHEMRDSTQRKIDPAAIEAIQKTIMELQSNLELRSEEKARLSRRAELSIDYLVSSLGGASITTVELCRALLTTGRHLSRDQFNKLLDTKIGTALQELRNYRILVPVMTASARANENPVGYWFPPGVPRRLETALSLTGRRSRATAGMVQQQLAAVGYDVDFSGNTGDEPSKPT